MLYKSFALLIIMCYCQLGVAQGYNRWFNEAQLYEAKKNTNKAAKCYLKAVDNAGSDPEIYAKAAQFFIENRYFNEAVTTYEQAVNKVGKRGEFTLQLANAYVLNNNLAKANMLLFQNKSKFTQQHPQYKEFDKLQRDINFQLSQPMVDSSTAIWPFNLGAHVNTSVDEYFPSIHGNDEELIFTRKTNNQDEDFYISIRDSLCNWIAVKDLGYPLNSNKNEGAHFLSMDRNYMFYMRCGNARTNERTMGNCDMYMAFKYNNSWSEGEPFGATINTPYYDGMPCLSSDNRVLYFVSDKPGGFGGKDIYVTKFIDGMWQVPENLGPNINSAYDELSPFIALDDHTLYFASNGHPGYGGFDLFVAEKNIYGEWGKPRNLGAVVNSSYNEISLSLHANGKKAYFASDRPSGYGGFDLYEVGLPQSLQPQPMSIVYGTIFDTLTEHILPSTIIEYYELGKEDYSYQTVSNRGDASYVIALPTNVSFERRVLRFGYAEKIDTVILTEQNITTFDQCDIHLLPEGYEEPIAEFELGKLNYKKNQLEPDQELLYFILKQLEGFNHPNFQIRVYCFTDDSGTPFINEDISYKRARLVADEIRKLGFTEEQIDVRGWGDAKPLVPNISEANRDINRRLEISIIGAQHLFENLEHR